MLYVISSIGDFIKHENIFFFHKEAISTENAKGSTHSIKVVQLFSIFSFQISA